MPPPIIDSEPSSPNKRSKTLWLRPSTRSTTRISRAQFKTAEDMTPTCESGPSWLANMAPMARELNFAS